MRSILLLLALAVVPVAGCGSACKDLADRICNCEPAGSQRDGCKNTVTAQLNATSPSEADQKLCQQLLNTCPDPVNDPAQCDVLRTPAGKAACGLSY